MLHLIHVNQISLHMRNSAFELTMNLFASDQNMWIVNTKSFCYYFVVSNQYFAHVYIFKKLADVYIHKNKLHRTST